MPVLEKINPFTTINLSVFNKNREARLDPSVFTFQAAPKATLRL